MLRPMLQSGVAVLCMVCGRLCQTAVAEGLNVCLSVVALLFHVYELSFAVVEFVLQESEFL